MGAMEMPKLTDEHHRLHAFVGEWVGEEQLSPSPWGPGGPAVGRSVCRLALDGFHVLQDYVEEKDGKTTFKGHGVFGYDTETREFCWYWFDSMGFVPDGPARGKWEGDTMTLIKVTPRGHGRYVYRWTDERTYHFSIENSFDGGKTFTRLMEGTYRRG
jgi:hypothetical protein